MLSIQHLNSLAAAPAEGEFRKCCGSSAWTTQMAAARPFASLEQMIEIADRIWWSLQADDWLEAFHSHPKIGGKKAQAETPAQSKQWSAGEQAGVAQASSTTLQQLAELNERYEQKFGYIFIVCATGKSSEEIMRILEHRLENGADEELRIAAAEQAKITALRLEKLLNG